MVEADLVVAQTSAILGIPCAGGVVIHQTPIGRRGYFTPLPVYTHKFLGGQFPCQLGRSLCWLRWGIFSTRGIEKVNFLGLFPELHTFPGNLHGHLAKLGAKVALHEKNRLIGLSINLVKSLRVVFPAACGVKCLCERICPQKS